MASGKSVFGSIKSKLGIDRPNNSQAEVYDEYDEYAEYDDGYDDGYDDYPQDAPYDDYDSYGYGNRHKVTTRTVGAGLPRLVTREDARESTRSSSMFGRESLSGMGSGIGRTMVDSSLPSSMTPEGTTAISAVGNSRRAEGLDSLFGGSSPRTEARSASLDSPSISAAAFTGKRNLQVIKPSRYDDAEGVARALKLGNVAVLVLTNASDALSRRILDFAFGATSALGGGVEAIGPKTYALTVQAGLTETEKAELANLGVI